MDIINKSLSQILAYYQALGFVAGEEIWLNNYKDVFRGVLHADRIELWVCRKAGVDSDGISIWRPRWKIPNPIPYLRELGKQGLNIQSYPNHLKGGLGNKHASRFTTCFYEIDDLPKAEQEAKLQWFEDELNLKPAVSVFSGGKSLHNYFALSEPVDEATWLRLNRKLAIVSGGDPAICTLARAMRLPGVPRLKGGQLREVEIVTSNPNTYSAVEFEEILDSTGLFPFGLDQERWLKWRKHRDISELSVPPAPPSPEPPFQAPTTQPTQPIREYDGSAIPLEICLGRHDRELIAAGTGEGSRNVDGYKLARNLVGTVNSLMRLGIRWDGEPRLLFEEFAGRCNPPLSPQDIERIWKSANRGNPTASLNDEAIHKCVGWWLFKQNQPAFSGGKKSGFISKAEWLKQFKFPQEIKAIAGYLKKAYNRAFQKYLKSEPATSNNTTLSSPTVPLTSAIVPCYEGHTIYDHPAFSIDKSGNRVFKYLPGNLPTLDRWQWLNRPQIIFEKKDRRKLIAEAVAKGWKNIKDESGTGSGKSHDLGLISLKDYPTMNRVFYLSDDAENPTTAPVERNFERLVTRHDGQKYDHQHKTPMGDPYIRRVKAGETLDIPGNCPETQTFLKFQQKGLSIGGGADSPICQACPLIESCQFLADRQQQLIHSDFLRAHPDQMVSDFKAVSQAIAIWDEPGKVFQNNRLIQFNWAELQKGLASLQAKDSELHSYLTPIFAEWFGKLLNAKINPKYGMSFVELRELLGLPALVNLPTSGTNYRLISTIKLAAAADKLINPTISFSGIQSPADKQQWIDNEWHPHYFSLLFGALSGRSKKVSISIDHEWNFTVSVPYYRHRKTAAAMGVNIWLDATLSTGDLAMMTGIKKNEILAIEEAKSDYSNLTIKIVSGVGSCGMNRETEGVFSQQQRINHLITSLTQFFPDTTGIIEFKKYVAAVNNGISGYWFLDNRGSNAFRDCDQLIAIGSPLPNLGALAMAWAATRGLAVEPTHLGGGFGRWVDRLVVAEVVQLVGRLRAQLSAKPKTCWLVSDQYPQNVAIELGKFYPGCTVEFIDVADICVAAATKGVQRERAMITSMWDALGAGLACTTSTIGAAVGVTRGRISQMARGMGGFEAVKRVLIFLIDALKGKLTPPQLDETVRLFAQMYLPEVLEEMARNQAPPASPPPASSAYSDDDIEWGAGVMRLFASEPWDYVQGLSQIVDDWGTAYLSLVWRKLGIWERRFLKAFAWDACKQLA